MNKQSRANYIVLLKKLDDGLLKDLDCLITDLEKDPEDGPKNANAGSLAIRALQGLAAVLTLVTNVRELLK